MSETRTYDPSTHIVRARVADEMLQRAANVNRRPLIVHLIKFATYLGLGALVHAWFLGPDFDADSLWSWGYVAAWPVPLTVWFVVQAAVFGLYAMLLIVGCALFWAGLCLAHDAHRARKARRERNRNAGIYDPRD